MPHGMLHTATDPIFNQRKSRGSIFALSTKNKFILIFFFCIFIYIFLYIYVLPASVIIDEDYARGVDEKLIVNKEGFRKSLLTTECSKITDACFVVIDKKIEVANGELVERHMFLKGFEEESDTVVKLIPPSGQTFQTSDSRMWKIDHQSIRAQYIAALISAPFIVSTLSLVDQDNDGKSILEIGLGGGSLDMFLHQLNPKINITAVEIDPIVVKIAKRWFNVKDDETRRTITADGLKFIEDAASNGDKYDVVFLDACDSSPVFPCPSENFRKPEVFETLHKIVSPTGALIINILPFDDDDKEPQKMIEQVSEYFGSCLKVTITDEFNIIAICPKQAITDSQANVDFLKRRAVAVTMRLGLQDVLKTINMS